ncbi:hypothetical protein HD554DRAFT_1670443 [Boletus coccyginus]|nr:hypothetical protein HD554DRAFT_1670443 [Boletus coccyginus]
MVIRQRRGNFAAYRHISCRTYHRTRLRTFVVQRCTDCVRNSDYKVRYAPPYKAARCQELKLPSEVLWSSPRTNLSEAPINRLHLFFFSTPPSRRGVQFRTSVASERQQVDAEALSASRDLGGTSYVFPPFLLVLWKEDLRDKVVAVALSRRDQLVNTEAVRKYLRGRMRNSRFKEGGRLEVLCYPKLDHAMVFHTESDSRREHRCESGSEVWATTELRCDDDASEREWVIEDMYMSDRGDGGTRESGEVM